MSNNASRMARLRLHRLCLSGVRFRCPILGPRHRCRRWTVPPAHHCICVGCVGDGQEKGRARIARLSSLQRLFRTDTDTGTTLHALRHCTNGRVINRTWQEEHAVWSAHRSCGRVARHRKDRWRRPKRTSLWPAL